MLCLPLLVACSSHKATSLGDRPYERGEQIKVTGVVTDTGSRPVEGVEVVFQAARQKYDYVRLRKRQPVTRSVTAETSTAGAFELDWPWDKGFNHFVLFFGVTVGGPDGDQFHELHRKDISRLIQTGSPVVTAVELEDTEFLVTFREFLESLDSQPKRDIYREAGKPDKVRRSILPEHEEVDWWYFELGKVYHFRDGSLDSVEEFEPVEGFEKAAN